MGHNPAVPLRKPLAAALLLLAAAVMPQLLWLGSHALLHHEHASDAAGHRAHDAKRSELAQVLTHGHGHSEQVPEHEHHVRPSPPLRADAPREIQAPGVASLEAPNSGYLLPSSTRPWQGETRLSGSSPPRLQLLCTLLI
ncbi:MAG TPA: hypothetical protein VKK31_23310 [Thermoanaerobaculia bacterium]|nr:hypothetical protein [Thermoanaerobaculia bacterium]